MLATLNHQPVAAPNESSPQSLKPFLRAEAARLRSKGGELRLEELLADLRITLSRARELGGNAHGLLRLRNDDWEIVLPGPDTRVVATALSSRERFTVAHEIGHFVLHRHGVASPRRRSDYWRLEEMCNWFAGQLLISDRELGEAFPTSAEVSATNLLVQTKMLATTLVVSFEASARRVTDYISGSALARIQLTPGTESVLVVEWATESQPWLRAGRGRRLKPEHPLFGLIVEQGRGVTTVVREMPIPPHAVVASQWSRLYVDVAARIR
jgi:hypothetical protein